jgi:transcriptional regulator with XRE-family HTH domain
LCFFGELHKGGLNILDGLAFVQMIEAELKKRNIPKERFYAESGISSATMSQWRKRIYSPSSAAIKKIEDYLGIVFSIEHKEKTPTPQEEDRRYNIIKIVGRNGSYEERILTDEQISALKVLLSQLPDASGDL